MGKVKPLRCKTIHCFEAPIGSRICESFDFIRDFGVGWWRNLWTEWFAIRVPNSVLKMLVRKLLLFRSGLRSPDRKSIDLVRNFGAGSQIFWFRSELQSGFVNLLIQIRTSERGSRIIWFRSELRSRFVNLLIQIGTSERVCESFDSDQNFRARIANHLI